MTTRALLFLILTAACSSAPKFAAPPVAPAPPALVQVECDLPPLPDPPAVVGYPSPTTIYVTVDDLAAIMRSSVESTAWMRAAEKCLTPAPR